jgi:hypothetical protein
VKAKGAYCLALDRFNRVEFPAVETSAVRLELDTHQQSTTGLHEFRLDEKPVE